MSDDLVRRLRDRRVCSLAQNSCRNDWACEQAADRIEELEAANKRLRLEVAHANDTADVAIERAKELEAAIKRQAGAARTLRQLTLAEVQHLSDMDRSEYFAAQTINSERDANAILTDRIEELEVKLSSVKLELNAAVKLLAAAGDGLRLMARVEMAEAKLAVAVEALKKLHRRQDTLETFDSAVDDIVSTTLAELKGQDDA